MSFDLPKWQNLRLFKNIFHVKSEWQKDFQISTLCKSNFYQSTYERKRRINKLFQSSKIRRLLFCEKIAEILKELSQIQRVLSKFLKVKFSFWLIEHSVFDLETFLLPRDFMNIFTEKYFCKRKLFVLTKKIVNLFSHILEIAEIISHTIFAKISWKQWLCCAFSEELIWRILFTEREFLPFPFCVSHKQCGKF